MNRRIAQLTLALAMAVSACEGAQKTCSDGMDCPSGYCYPSTRSPSNFCVTVDVACSSGVRWSENAGDGLANACISGGSDRDMASTSNDLASPYDLASDDHIGFHFPDFSCPYVHNTGIGQSWGKTFMDCTPVGTYTQELALHACAVDTGDVSQCTLTLCGNNANGTNEVCALNFPGHCACWAWADDPEVAKGHVLYGTSDECSFACAVASTPQWN